MLPMINGRSKRGKKKKSKSKYTLHVSGNAENEETMEYLTRLGMNKPDIDELYSCFMEIAGSGKGKTRSFSLSQFYHWAQIRNDQIADFHADIFSVLEGGDIANGINFREFALVMWNFLSLHEEAGTTLPDFIFFLYDKAGNGVLKNAELRDIIWGLHGHTDDEGRLEAVMDHFKFSTRNPFELGTNMKAFAEMNRMQPFLCYPAFRLMKHLRLKIVGMDFWMRYRSKRRRRYQEAVDLWEMLAKENFDEDSEVSRHDSRLPRMVPPRLARDFEFDEYYLYKQSELWAGDEMKKVHDREKRLGIVRPATPEHGKWTTSQGKAPKITMDDAKDELRAREERARATELDNARRRKEETAEGKAAKKKKKKKKKGKDGGGAGEAQESRLSGRFASSMRKVSGGMGFL